MSLRAVMESEIKKRDRSKQTGEPRDAPPTMTLTVPKPFIEATQTALSKCAMLSVRRKDPPLPTCEDIKAAVFRLEECYALTIKQCSGASYATDAHALERQLTALHTTFLLMKPDESFGDLFRQFTDAVRAIGHDALLAAARDTPCATFCAVTGDEFNTFVAVLEFSQTSAEVFERKLQCKQWLVWAVNSSSQVRALVGHLDAASAAAGGA
jgi:hypothetical protein